MTIKEEIINDLSNYDSEEEKISYLKDVLRYGCVSGIVSNLIYYKDTNDFFDRNEDEIEDLISENMDMMGTETRPQFIDNLNGSAENMTQEKNLLSWFAYETKAKEVLEEDFHTEY